MPLACFRVHLAFEVALLVFSSLFVSKFVHTKLLNVSALIHVVLVLKGISKFQEQGMMLEKVLHIALTRLKVPHRHNPFDKQYADKEGKGCDVEILTSKGKIGIEAKNNNGKYGMSPYWLERECHSRFDSQHTIKIFLCAFLTISHMTAKKMSAMGYNLIQLGFKVTKDNFKRAIHKLIKKLYWIKKSFNFHAKPRTKTKQLPLSNTIRESCSVNQYKETKERQSTTTLLSIIPNDYNCNCIANES